LARSKSISASKFSILLNIVGNFRHLPLTRNDSIIPMREGCLLAGADVATSHAPISELNTLYRPEIQW
jgi:hypothetical protein